MAEEPRHAQKEKWGLVLTSAAVGAGPRACPNEGNHRGLPLQKMADNRIKPEKWKDPSGLQKKFTKPFIIFIIRLFSFNT